MEPWNDALSEDWVSQSRSSPPSLPSSVPLSFDQSDFGSDPPKSRIPQLKHLSRRLTSSTTSGGPRASLAKGEAGGSERVLRRSAGNRASAHRSYDAKSQLGYSEGRGPGQEPQAASVSSNQTTQQHTVQHKSPRQSPGKDGRGIGTPEWRKRLLKGDTSYGDKTDLFSPSGLENIFRPPLRQTARSKRAGLAKEKFTTFHDQPLPEETGDMDDPRLQDAHWHLGTKDDEGLKENIPPPKNIFDQSLGEDGEFNPIATSTWREDPQGRATVLDAFGVDAGQTTTPRISSGSQSSSNRSTNQRQDPDRQGEDSNEDISPIFISRHNTVDGRIDYAALDLADGTPQPLSNWSSRRYEEENTSRSSPALPSWRDEDIESSRLLPPFNSSEFLDVTSRRGFISVKRGGFSSEGSFQRRNLSPSSLPASAKSDELDQSVEQRQEGMDGDVSRKPLGSPMRLFAPNYDSFTRDKLSRRLSHIEDTMYIEGKGENANDCDSLDQLVINGSGEHQEEMAEFSLAGASQLSLPPLFAANPRTNDASQRTTSFGDGQLDKYTFHEDSSFGSLNEYSQESNSTPPAPKPLQREGSKFKFNLSSSPSEQASLPSRNILRTKIIASKTPYSDVAETVAPKKVNDATALPSEKGVTKYAFISGYTNSGSFVDRSETRGKRAPMSPARGPVAKKRRTLNADDFEATKEALISSNLVAENHRQMQSITGKRKDARYEDDQTIAKPEIVARRQILKPRALSNKKSTYDGQTNRSSSSAEPHKMNEAHIALEARVAAAEDQLNAMGIGQKMTEDRRKGSVTTQDFLDEATRVMEFIRARNRPRSGLTSLEESEMESQRQGESSVHRPESEILLEEDESTREEFSRPPSREGGRALPVKQLKELDPRILSHLQKYKDSESSGIPSSSIETLGVGNNNDASVKLGLETATRAASPEFESQPPNIRITHHTASSNTRKHLENASSHNRPNQDQALNSHGSCSSSQPSSIRSIPTGSSSRSNTKQNIAPGTITHLIPGQVAGMVYDGTLQRWVKAKSLSKKREALEARKGEDDSEEDPFGGIPDLSVNELEELERIKLAARKRRAEEGAVSGLFGPISGIEGERAAPEAPPTDGNDPTISRPQTRDGTMPRPTESSSVPSKISRFASSGPVPETRATSWGDTIDGAPWKQSPIHPSATVMVQEDQGDVEVVEHEIQYNEGRQPSGHDLGSATLHQLRRSVTVAFSSPLVSRSLNFEPDGDQVTKQEIWAETSHDDLNDSIVDQYLDVENSFVSDAGSDRRRSVSSTSISAYKGPPCRVSFGGQSFPARPVSRIEEQTEDSFMTVRRNERAKASFNVTVTTPLPVRSVDRSHTSDRKSHLTFHLSPLPDFTINQIDESFNLDVEHVAKHRGLLSMRDVETSYALQTERLVKHITDIQPYEPYWDYLQEVQLQRKGLITLCKLDQFCGRIERLDVSENELGQVHGVPNSIRDLKISRNCLSNLTAWAHLINLQYLDVSHNEIDDLSCFSMLIHLRELKADGNKVSSLQGAFGMNGLVSLKLRRNCLEVMDFAGANLTRLTDFNVQGNQLSSVRNLHHLPALTSLDLSDNQLESFSGDPKIPHPNLKTLRLTNNKLHSLDVHDFPDLRTIYVDNNFLTIVEGLRRTTHLDSLSVRQQSPPLDPDASTSLDINIYYEVRKLYLSSNTIPTLDPTIPFLNLQYLELANSGLQSLPPSFGSLFPNVRVLNLNFNALRDIRPLARITRLKKLFLAGNRLTRLRKTTTILERFRWLSRVDLRNNPLTLGFYPPLTESRVIVHKESEPADQDLIVDPYVLQDADPEKDAAYKARLDLDTKMRRRVYEMLIASGCPGLRVLDGLRWERERAVERDEVWTKLVEMGVVKDTEGETPAEGEAVEEAVQKDSGKVSPEGC